MAGAAGIDTAARQPVERCDGPCNTRLGQRKAAPGREVQFLLALALNQAVQPNVERRHRRARKPHASNNGDDKFPTWTHSTPRARPVKVPKRRKGGLKLKHW